MAEKKSIKQPTDSTRSGLGWKTVLFNCNCHTFQEVAIQLMKAIRCTYEKGMQLANVVHYTGSAVVYSGHRERCEAVASVLEDIGLIARVVQ
ncbi:MAG: ATP-dependent Clp protease adaptor ClpS [Elusimicrobia bacterium]|nr:ATP-dependent Clp protease adaptor ClpS [Elusimicrobiota bacterium]